MYDQLILELSNLIAREGITDEAAAKLTSVFDTLLYVEDYNTINIANIQTLLLLLQDHPINPVIKRLADELRYRLIRQSLGRSWQHGVIISEYTMNRMNKNLLEETYTMSVYQDGATEKTVQYSVQPLAPKERLVLNDMGQLALQS